MRYYGWLITSWQKTGSSFNWKLWTWEICVMQMRSSTLHTPVLVLECSLAVHMFYHTCRSFFNLFLSRSIRHLYHRLGYPNVTDRSSRAVTLKSRPKLCQHCRHRQTVQVGGRESMATCILQVPRRNIRNTWNQQHWIVHDMSTTAWVDTVLNNGTGKGLNWRTSRYVEDSLSACSIEIGPPLASVKLIRANTHRDFSFGQWSFSSGETIWMQN